MNGDLHSTQVSTLDCINILCKATYTPYRILNNQTYICITHIHMSLVQWTETN